MVHSLEEEGVEVDRLQVNREVEAVVEVDHFLGAVVGVVVVVVLLLCCLAEGEVVVVVVEVLRDLLEKVAGVVEEVSQPSDSVQWHPG